MFLLLLGSVTVYWLLGEPREAFMLGAAIVFMIAITLVQERRTEPMAGDLPHDRHAPEAKINRSACDGWVMTIPGR